MNTESAIREFISFTEDLKLNENIEVSFLKINKGYTKEHLADLETGLEIEYSKYMKDLFLQIGEVSLMWVINKPKFLNAIPEEDINFLTGSVQILNPFDMIMGYTGTRWKDVLWFEDMDPIKKQNNKDFIPFDYPSSELLSGFKKENNKLSNEMYLFDDDELEITPFHFELEQYLIYLVKTKGYFYWQEFIKDKSSTEYKRFMKYMPQLFKDFDSVFFE